jgi:signal transduction histidine kinase
VLSEALANVAKNAQASAVNVELDTHDAIVQLTIRDDGIGRADLSQGSGLLGLSGRIEALHGTRQVTSPRPRHHPAHRGPAGKDSAATYRHEP